MKNKIKISYESGEVVIEANKDGLKHLSEVCQRLSNLTEAEVNTPASHHHISGDMGNAEQGSVPIVIIHNSEL